MSALKLGRVRVLLKHMDIVNNEPYLTFATQDATFAYYDSDFSENFNSKLNLLMIPYDYTCKIGMVFARFEVTEDGHIEYNHSASIARMMNMFMSIDATVEEFITAKESMKDDFIYQWDDQEQLADLYAIREFLL